MMQLRGAFQWTPATSAHRPRGTGGGARHIGEMLRLGLVGATVRKRRLTQDEAELSAAANCPRNGFGSKVHSSPTETIVSLNRRLKSEIPPSGSPSLKCPDVTPPKSK